MINTENWTSSAYESDKLKAYVTFGGESSPEGMNLLYFLTVVEKEDHHEIFQEAFKDLTICIESINNRYSHWKFKDLAAPSGGCSSCQAH